MDAVTIDVRVSPRASRSEIAGLENGVLKVRISAPPVDNAANTELIKLLAKKLGVAKRDVSILSGEASRNKRIRINNLSRSTFNELVK